MWDYALSDNEVQSELYALTKLRYQYLGFNQQVDGGADCNGDQTMYIGAAMPRQGYGLSCNAVCEARGLQCVHGNSATWSQVHCLSSRSPTQLHFPLASAKPSFIEP